MQGPTPAELAAAISAKLCHDFISPTGAIVSGVDLLQDPDSQDMRDDAVNLIADSAKKQGALLEFYRVAFGASAAAEAFDTRELNSLTTRVFEYQRAELEWAIDQETLIKPAARAALNIIQMAGSALPRGGTARISSGEEEGGLVLTARAEGDRISVKDEVTRGLSREPLGDGMAGYWVQGFYVASFVAEAGGSLDFTLTETSFEIVVRLPA